MSKFPLKAGVRSIDNSYRPKARMSDLGAVNMFYGASPVLFELAKYNRENPTESELFLWNHLSGNKLKGFRFKRQHPIKYFIADFYCHKAKLIIEVDGGYHNVQEQYQYDRNRDYELEELGLSVLHFTNEEVVDNIEVVLEKIKEELTPKSPEGDLADARL